MQKISTVPTILVMNDCYWLPYCLESLRGRFYRYVIYDVGSTDGTLNIIDWFIETEKAEFFIRKLPKCEPEVQGTFRNSMIAEAQSDWFFIVDADEVYSEQSLNNLHNKFGEYLLYGKPYGVFRRKEISSDLTQCYDIERTHHRIYFANAIFKGPHPGEDVVIPQNKQTEYHFKDVLTYHFHNTLRSPAEADVPKRIKRKQQKTYHPGNLIPFDLLKELPLLRKPINNFPVNPELEKLQYAINKV